MMLCALATIGVRAEIVTLGEARSYLETPDLSLMSVPADDALEDAIDVSGIVSYSNSKMLLHEAEPSDNYVYWYHSSNTNVDMLTNGDVTITISEANQGKLADILDAVNQTQSSGYFNKVKIVGKITTADIAALNKVDAKVLDLSEATFDNITDLEEASNSKVKFLVLPNGQTRDDVYQTRTVDADGKVYTETTDTKLSDGIVNATSLKGFTGLYSAVSFTRDGSNFDFVAYNKKAGMLQAGLVAAGQHTGVYDNTMTRNGRVVFCTAMADLSNRSATISGPLNAYDLTQGPSVNQQNSKLDANGHLTFDKTYAAEYYAEDGYNANGEKTHEKGEMRDADDRVNIGTESIYGAFNACNGVATLDLEQATFEYINDMSISRLQPSGNLTKLVLPTDASVTETPSYMITSFSLKELLIPSNIQTIRTHLAPSLDHVWTNQYATDADNTAYDNGVYNSTEDKTYYGYTGQSFGGSKNDYRAGTYTFSSNLKLIETGAFANTEPHVKDVYVLAVEAPECHVDAFNTSMYVGSSGFSPEIKDGIITRDSYRNSDTWWITMLHYPRDCGTPDVQRYTDVTREYNIATGMVDGKGATIYFPTFSEFLRAYAQGTTGYLWNAWDPTREYNQLKNNLAIANEHWKPSIQNSANTQYLSNTEDGKDYTSFYDVTANGLYDQPEGLVPYNTVYWDNVALNNTGSGVQLYPAAEQSAEAFYAYVPATQEDFDNGIVIYAKNGNDYTTYSGSYADGLYKRVQRQAYDENGKPQFEQCTNGHYVKVDGYEPKADGEYVQVATVASYASTTTPVEGVTTYYEDNAGETAATPKVGTGFYVEDGTQNVFSDAVYYPTTYNGELVTTYYTKDNSGNYTESPMRFSTKKYHTPETSYQSTYSGTYNLVFGVAHYYSDPKGKNEVVPTLSINGGTLYYKDADGVYHATTVFVPGQGDYYVKFDYSDYLPVNDSYPQVNFGGTQYYYASGEGEVTTYSETDYWLPNVTTYYSDENGTVYYNGTGNWPGGAFDAAYYYVTGTVPAYSSAEGKDYNATTAYYTDNTGATEAQTVTFDQTYYYPVYEYTYEEYTDQEGERYTKVDVYREGTAEELAAATTRYCPVMEDVEFYNVVKANDYRGWHQFVLTGYAANTTEIITQHRSYVTDNDWWTICLPFDLNYKEMMLLYGDPDAGKVPYLSLLTNVVRNMNDLTITLNFTKNLMTHKATQNQDTGVWEVSDEAPSQAADAQGDDVVLHAGVPYMIRPNIANGANRQFDIYGQETINEKLSAGRVAVTINDYPLLYGKVKASQEFSGSELRALVEEGLYTVPALVASESGALATEATGSETVTYDGKTYPVSSEWDYTFVGSLFQNFLPSFSYFLGYDTQARFFFADNITSSYVAKDGAPDYVNEMYWNNNTGVIIPNLLSSSCTTDATKKYNLKKGKHDGKVHVAWGSGQNTKPAQWLIGRDTGLLITDDLKNDWFENVTAPSGAKTITMVFGVDVETETSGVEEITADEGVNANGGPVYSVNGRYMGSDTKSLSRGIYIQNGKKIVVK